MLALHERAGAMAVLEYWRRDERYAERLRPLGLPPASSVEATESRMEIAPPVPSAFAELAELADRSAGPPPLPFHARVALCETASIVGVPDLIDGIVALRECTGQPPWDQALIDTDMVSIRSSVQPPLPWRRPLACNPALR